MPGDCSVDDGTWRTSILQVLEQTREGADNWDVGDLGLRGYLPPSGSNVLLVEYSRSLMEYSRSPMVTSP